MTPTPPGAAMTVADLDPDRLYPTGVYAAVIGCTVRTAENHIGRGHVAAVRVGPNGQYRIRGSEIIRLAGGVPARPTETAGQRRARAAAAVERLKQLARKK